MAHLKTYTFQLGLKILLLSVVSSFLAWYFMVNPSTPAIMSLIVAIGGSFGFAYVILSTVGTFVENEYKLAE